MARTLGTLTRTDDGSFIGVLKTLNITTNLAIVPTDRLSEEAPDHRVYAGGGQRYEIGAGWSQTAKSSGQTYLNLKMEAPEIAPSALYARLVKLEQPADEGHTHIILWEARDR